MASSRSKRARLPLRSRQPEPGTRGNTQRTRGVQQSRGRGSPVSQWASAWGFPSSQARLGSHLSCVFMKSHDFWVPF